MAKTIIDLKDIVKLGGGLSIDATMRTTTDLKDLARLLAPKATLIIRNADSKIPSDLKEIAKIASGAVIFEI